jgi:Uma2 family endonuclease
MSRSAQELDFSVMAELLALPEEGRGFEMIDGVLTEKPLASGRHGGAQLKLGVALDPYHRRPGPRGPGGWIFGSEVLVEFDARHVLRPDVAGWRHERLAAFPEEPVLTIIPDWVCEILSPSNARNDTVRKKRVFHRHAVGHYWILDPMRETLSVYRWTDVAYLEVLTAERGERVRAEPFDAVEFDVGVFFGDDG